MGEDVSEPVDALVIGGGPAGATAAVLLARAGWCVTLVERKRFPRRKVCGEYMSATTLPLLERLGVAEAFLESAGPPVCEVGLYAGQSELRAKLPRPASAASGWGRALSRERLDTLLVSQAEHAGVRVLQPFAAIGMRREREAWACRVRDEETDVVHDIAADVVLAAHGSWETGTLPTQPSRSPAKADDLFAFKAHFRGSALPDGLMPLLAFPGGYGGMVQCDDGRVSLSCCVRRDVLVRLRQDGGSEAGEAVLGHIAESCLGVRRALARAKRDGRWLAAGPIRPGVRLRSEEGVFRIGNAAGEAHPVIAEGISMAMQGAWLACEKLQKWKREGGKRAMLGCVAGQYADGWRRSFSARLQASRVVAQWAMRSGTVRAVVPLLRMFPSLLTLGARLSGKAARPRLLRQHLR